MIKKLLESGVCFIVVQSYSYLTKAKIMENQEWEIIAAEKDLAKLQSFVFLKNNSLGTPLNFKNPTGIVSKVLKAEDISEFRRLLPEHFVKAKKTSDGTVWEIKERSFKQYLKAS